MRRLLSILGLFAFAFVAAADAQLIPFPQSLPANTVVGRLGVSAGPAQAVPFATLTNNLLAGICTSQNGVPVFSTVTGWSCSVPVPIASGGTATTTAAANTVLSATSSSAASFTATTTLGTNGGTGGQFTLNGSTSGSVVVKVPAIAGTTTFQYPGTNGTNGQFLQTNGSGIYTPAYPTYLNDITLGATCNAIAVSDAAMTSGSTTLTSATASFSASNVGNYIAVGGAAAAGANLFTTIAGFTNSTTVTLSASNASGGSISSKFAEFGADDTTTLNSNIAAAAAVKRGGYIPPNKTCLVSRLNLTGLQSFILQGPGPNAGNQGPALLAKNDSSYGTANGHLIDLTGSLYVQIRDLQVGAYYELSKPTTGVFMAQIASNASNRITLGPNFYVSGQFSNATVYNYGVPSSTCLNADFYNYASGAGTQDVMRMTSTNSGSMTSSFATVTSGTKSTSDWHFLNCEWHKFAGAGASNDVIQLDGTANVGFFGGVISGGAVQYVSFANAVTNTSFSNVTMETESEPVTPTNGFLLNSGATVTGLEWPQSSFIKSGNLVGTGGGTIASLKRGTPYMANSAGGMAPGTALTYFFGTGVNDTVANSNTFSLATGGMVFANMQCRSSASAGGGFTYTETFQLAGADTSLTCAMANPATTCSDTAHIAEATAAGNGINLKHVASNVGANTTRMACSVEMQPY